MKIFSTILISLGIRTSSAVNVNNPAAEGEQRSAVLCVRRGIVALFILQVVYIVANVGNTSGDAGELIAFGVANWTLLALSFAYTFTPGFRHAWQLITLLCCMAVLAMGALSSIVTHDGGWSIFIVILFSLGCSVCIPWGQRWQALLNLFCLASLMTVTRYASAGDPLIWYHGVALLAALVLSPIAAWYLESNRRRKRGFEARTRAVIDGAFDGIITMDVDGRITSWNPKAESIFGWSRGEAIGRTFLELVIPKEERVFVENAARIEGGSSQLLPSNQSFELNAVNRDGQRFPIELTFSEARSEGRSFFVAFARDITERKWAEEQRSLLASIVESAEDAIFSVTLAGIINSWNPGAEKLYGYTTEEIVGRPSSILVPANLLTQGHELMERLAREERVQFIETRRLRKDRSLVEVGLTASPIYSDAGRIAGVSVITRNITEQKRFERELRESEEKFRKIFDAGTELITINTLADGRYVDVNEQFQQKLGYTRDEAIGRTPRELGVWADHADLAKVVNALNAHGFVRNIEAEFVTRYGERRLGLFSAVLIHFADELCVLSFARDITERKQAEQELRESEETFRRIFEASTDAITINTFTDGAYVAVNGEFTKLSGYEREEVIGRTSRELRIWANKDEAKRALKALDESGIVRNFEVDFRTKSGAIAACSFSGVVMNFHGERCVLSLVRDVAERRRAEQTRSLLAAIVQSNDDAILSGDLNWNVTSFNPGAEKLYGYTAAEILGQPLDRLIPPERRDEIKTMRSEIKTHRKVWRFETQRLKKDGTRFDASLTLSPVYDEHGAVVGVSAITKDISERNRVDRELRESEEKFRKVFEASLDSISINSFADGTYLAVNDNLIRYMGYTREEVIGKTPRELKIWARREHLAAAMADLKSKGIAVNLEAEFVSKSGVHWPGLFSAVVITLDNQPCILSFSRDITELKRAERDLVEAREQALAASRAKSAFLATISHEIRTPMNAIIGMAELLAESPLTSEQSGFVRIARNAGNALLSLLDDVLDLSKIEGGHLMLEEIDFDLEELVEETVESFALRAHEKGLDLLYEIAPDVPGAFKGDPTRLRQVIANLISNAVKFTARGEVTVRVENDAAAGEPGRLRFSVSDTGIGIPSDKMKAVFESFTQVDNSITRRYGGSGLGLAISKRLVEAMGGRIWLESEPGKGTVFYFTVDLKLAPDRPEIEASLAIDLAEVKILVADDNASQRRILREMLEHRGALVDEAADYASALEELKRAKQAGTPFRLMLMDGCLAAGRALDFAGNNGNGSGIVESIILAVASTYLSRDLERARQLGVELHVVKPISRHDLLRVIRSALLKGGSRVEQLARETTALKPDRRALRILLAEDSEDNRVLVEAYLKQTSYQLESAENGEIAVSKFTSAKYDLVLMDMQMPVMDGYTAVRAMRAWERTHDVKRTPILALTAYALKEEIGKSLDAGCDAHLSKPIKKRTLLEAIQEATTPVPEIYETTVAEIDPELAPLMPRFLKRKRDDIVTIRDHIEQKDYETVRVLGHNIKGEGGGYGLDALTRIGSSIEEAAQMKDSEQLHSLVDALAVFLAKVELLMSSRTGIVA